MLISAGLILKIKINKTFSVQKYKLNEITISIFNLIVIYVI